MAKHEKYQVYNSQNKQFVLMRNGQILDNSYFQFEGVPLFGGAPDRPEETPKEAKNGDSKNTRHSENDTASGHKNGAQKDKEEDSSGIFEWF